MILSTWPLMPHRNLNWSAEQVRWVFTCSTANPMISILGKTLLWTWQRVHCEDPLHSWWAGQGSSQNHCETLGKSLVIWGPYMGTLAVCAVQPQGRLTMQPEALGALRTRKATSPIFTGQGEQPCSL